MDFCRMNYTMNSYLFLFAFQSDELERFVHEEFESSRHECVVVVGCTETRFESSRFFTVTFLFLTLKTNYQAQLFSYQKLLYFTNNPDFLFESIKQITRLVCFRFTLLYSLGTIQIFSISGYILVFGSWSAPSCQYIESHVV